MLNDILDQMDYRTHSGYNGKGCIHFIERSSIACNKIPCLFNAIDLEREVDYRTESEHQAKKYENILTSLPVVLAMNHLADFIIQIWKQSRTKRRK